MEQESVKHHICGVVRRVGHKGDSGLVVGGVG